MLQIIPIDKRKPGQVDTDTVKYIENNGPKDSMTAKYNRAIESYVMNSNHDVICFRHDDTEIRTPLDSCEYKIRKLTEDHQIAVVGVIGTIALDRTCSWWTGVTNAGGRDAYGSGFIIQGGMRLKIVDGRPLADKNGDYVMEKYEYPMKDHPGCHSYLATVDGCCMWFPKWFFDEGFRFDENIQNFHFYDADICLQALAAGYKVSTCDLVVKHDSPGGIPPIWEQLRQNFYNKWNAAVGGEWPISRLSKFDMSRIKVNQNALKERLNGSVKTKEN